MEMHILVIFGLIIYIICRFVGVVISIDMYYKSRNNRHFMQLAGWIALLFSASIPFGLSFTQSFFIADFIYIISGILLNIGLYLLLSGFSLYFRKFNRNRIIIFIFVALIIPILTLIFFDLNIAGSISTVFQIAIIINFLTSIYTNLNDFKKLLQYSYALIVILLISIFIYFISTIVVSTLMRSHGHYYGIYISNDIIPIITNFSSASMLTLVGIILFLHLEHGINLQQNFLLKDDYSHKIGNILQVIMGAGTNLSRESDPEKIKTNSDIILRKSEEAGELVKEIRKI